VSVASVPIIAERKFPAAAVEVLPLEARPGSLALLSARRQTQLLWGLVGLGILARAVRYLLCFPLWADECALAANLLDRGYLDLLRPLDHEQVCPVGFLWTQKLLVDWLGFSEFSLRLPAFACSIASLLLFRCFAGRLLRGSALLMAVGIFAVAYPGIRYAAEAKPYGCDTLLALVLLTVVVQWWQRGRDERWAWLLAALIPVAMLFSYPVVFIAGACSIVMACVLWTSGSRRGWLPWAACNAALLGSVAALYLLSARAQSAAELQTMQFYWQEAFPPLGEPLHLLRWLWEAHTGAMLAYPVGGASGGSTVTFLFCLVAVAVLCRRRQFLLLVLCLAPLALTFAAAALKRYPYGGVVRFQLYMAPIFCLLAGLGLAVLLAWYPRKWALRWLGPEMVAALALLSFAAVSLGRDLGNPVKNPIDAQFRHLAQRLWLDSAQPGETLCLHTDLQQGFSPNTFLRRCSAMYLCNQRIYSAGHARAEPPHFDCGRPLRPLRCVEFVSADEPYDEAALQRWLDSMKSHYELIGRERYPLGDFDPQKAAYVAEAYVVVYTFAPQSE